MLMVITIKSQRGVGLMEVLVALLLLAIGVLGFTALQLRAVDATSEALNRIQAMNLARDLAESIRANKNSAALYQTELNKDTQLSTPVKSCLVTNITVTTTPPPSNFSNGCSSAEMANHDTAAIVAKATSLGLKVKMPDCPSMTTTTGAGANAVTTGSNRACIYVAWGKTTPTDVAADSDTACTKSGSYQLNSQCIIMEAY